MEATNNVSLSSVSVAVKVDSPFIPWSNPDNIISARTEAILQKVVICAATEVVMILGIPGNVVNMVVFTRQGLKDRVTLMLFCLAIVDFFNLLCYFSINFSCFLRSVDPVLAWNVQTVQYPQVLYVNLMAGVLSVSLVTVLSVDRCLAISLPLQASRVLTYKRTVITIAGVSMTIIGVYIPSLWFNSIAWVTDPVSNRSMAKLVPTDFALRNQIYFDFLFLFMPTIKLICLVSVVISCCITVKALRAASKLRADMAETKLQKTDVQITVMLLFVCTVMVVCLIPELLVTVVFRLVPDFYMFRKYHNIFVVCQYFIFFVRSVNSASNFYMYVLLSSKFRSTLSEVLACRRK